MQVSVTVSKDYVSALVSQVFNPLRVRIDEIREVNGAEVISAEVSSGLFQIFAKQVTVVSDGTAQVTFAKGV